MSSEVISTLIDWNYPPAFPAGIPTSASGHLATPSSEESNAEFAVHKLDIEINSPKSVDEEISSHLLVHEEVVTQEKDLNNAPENAEILTDHATLSIPEPAVVEDLGPQSLSQTFIVDPSCSHILPIRIAEHGEGVMSEEAAKEHKIVEITSEDVTLDNENESAPAQQNLEDVVDDEIESWGADASMQETKTIGKSFTSSLGMFPILISRRCQWPSSITGFEFTRCSERRR